MLSFFSTFNFQLSIEDPDPVGTFNSPNPNSGSKNENQKTERRTCLETIGRPARAAPAFVGHRPHRLFASPAAQPPGRETPPPVFAYVAGTQYPAIHRAGAQGRAPARR